MVKSNLRSEMETLKTDLVKSFTDQRKMFLIKIISKLWVNSLQIWNIWKKSSWIATGRPSQRFETLRKGRKSSRDEWTYSKLVSSIPRYLHIKPENKLNSLLSRLFSVFTDLSVFVLHHFWKIIVRANRIRKNFIPKRKHFKFFSFSIATPIFFSTILWLFKICWLVAVISVWSETGCSSLSYFSVIYNLIITF